MSGRQLALMVEVVVAVGAGGCASAGNDGEPVRTDASISRDAPAAADAGLPSDARGAVDAPPPPLDAPPGSLFCTGNSQCTVAGECCLDLGGAMGFCTPGTILLGECTPF